MALLRCQWDKAASVAILKQTTLHERGREAREADKNRICGICFDEEKPPVRLHALHCGHGAPTLHPIDIIKAHRCC